MAAKIPTPRKRKIRARLFLRDGDRCWVCNRKLTMDTATIDHVQERCNGGDNTEANLKLACGPCNRSRPPDERAAIWKMYNNRRRNRHKSLPREHAVTHTLTSCMLMHNDDLGLVRCKT